MQRTKVGKIVEKGFKRFLYLEIFGNVTVFEIEGNEVYYKKENYKNFLKVLKGEKR